MYNSINNCKITKRLDAKSTFLHFHSLPHTKHPNICHTSQESSADNQEQTDGSNEIPEMENKGEIKGESADNQEKTDGSDIVICA